MFTSFLQRDTLILVLGALAASGDINLVVMGMARIVAVITGNVLNYFAGR